MFLVNFCLIKLSNVTSHLQRISHLHIKYCMFDTDKEINVKDVENIKMNLVQDIKFDTNTINLYYF